MRRRVKDFIEISDYTSLDTLIRTLTAIRDHLPADAEPELALKGDEVFGHRLSISYFRELTVEEATCDARYTGADIPESSAEIDRLREQLDEISYARDSGIANRQMRRVA